MLVYKHMKLPVLLNSLQYLQKQNKKISCLSNTGLKEQHIMARPQSCSQNLQMKAFISSKKKLWNHKYITIVYCTIPLITYDRVFSSLSPGLLVQAVIKQCVGSNFYFTFLLPYNRSEPMSHDVWKWYANPLASHTSINTFVFPCLLFSHRNQPAVAKPSYLLLSCAALSMSSDYSCLILLFLFFRLEKVLHWK